MSVIHLLRTCTLSKNAEKGLLAENGFLKYQVRIMCGYLISVSLGKIEKGKIKYYLSNPQKKVTTKTAVATGLYLKEVKY